MNISKETKNLIFHSAVATTAMTLFSFALSGLARKQYREPELLGGIIEEHAPGRKTRKLEGWLFHYFIGILFSIVYDLPETNVMLPRKKTTFFGFGSGFFAALVWTGLLKAGPRTARQVNWSFFAQLVPAHAVFTYVYDKMRN